MKKVILDFTGIESKAEAQEYLAMMFDFPDYYGMNLDALYDCLTDIDEYTCIGCFLPDEDSPIYDYMRKMMRVFRDAERANRRIGVIFDEIDENEVDEELAL